MSIDTRRLLDQVTPIVGLAPITPSTSTPDYVSLKGYERCAAIIVVDNGATVTGSAITLLQASDVSGTGEKTLAFDTVQANIDVGAGSAYTETAVVSDTFTTDTTDNKNLVYVIDIPVDAMDDGFDCVRVGTGDGANMALSVAYLLYNAKYSGQAIDPIVD